MALCCQFERKYFVVLQNFSRASSNEAKARLKTLFSIQRVNGWTKQCKKVTLTQTNQNALGHFDKYYTHLLGAASWSGIRAALLAPAAKVAVLNSINPSMPELIKELLSKQYFDLFDELSKGDVLPESVLPQNPDNVEPPPDQHFLVRHDTPPGQFSEFVPPTEFISEKTVYTRESDRGFVVRARSDFFEPVDLPVVNEESCLIESFRNLRCFALPLGTFSALQRPKFSAQCFDFYPLDLGSVLAVLALDIQPGTRMLDLCSAPGGKAVAALQTLNLEYLVCTDVSSSRVERLKNVLNTFGPGVGTGRPSFPDVEVMMTHSIRRRLPTSGPEKGTLFNRVLVDVPCSTDRTALTSDKGSYFSKGKGNSRINLPVTQKRLLQQAMAACQVGGYVVYSTCTLSTAQNQAVVESCLTSPEKNAEFAIVDPTHLLNLCNSKLAPISGIKVAPAYSTAASPIGVLVLPCLAANYGPTFICKLKRVA
uniref:NOL1/NOP2/Sun domain family member 4 n=2 Tax=Mesocestoides corti TaxID=53468 RepID=A0A5K3EKI9_MESCO